jgi:hypothetical protein
MLKIPKPKYSSFVEYLKNPRVSNPVMIIEKRR